MFSWPNKSEHASFGRNETSVELAQKNLANLHWKFDRRHQQQNFLYRNETLSASVCKKNCRVSAEKYQSRLYNDRRRLLSLQFDPRTKFAWCRLGNVRSASSCEASFLDLDRSSFLTDVDCHFFRSISVKNIFLPRWGNVFLAEEMGTSLFRPKQNVGWARTKKPCRHTLSIFYATPKQENFLCF